MLDGYHILTLTHRHAALSAIGETIVRDDSAAALQALKSHFGWDELLYLATCNRVVYLFYTPTRPAQNLAADLLAYIRPELDADTVKDLAGGMRLLHGGDAVRHLLEVAASMDSLIVGEREIIRQLRESFEQSRAKGLTGDQLRLLLRFTIETAKEVYTETGIGEKAVSVVALAFKQLLETGLRSDARVLLVGAGQTNALVTKFLVKYGFRNVTVFNRTLEKAEALAQQTGGRALPFEALDGYAAGFDALIVCTGATQAVITPELYRQLLAGEADTKIVVDLAVPNNVDKRISEIFPLQFIEIEGLRDMARENLAHREHERQKADSLLTNKVRLFRETWHQRQVERALLPIVEEVAAAKNRAVNEVFAKEFASLDDNARALVLRMLGYVEKKSVAIAMRTAKDIALNAGRHMAAAQTSFEKVNG